MKYDHLAIAIEKKYGRCADTAIHKDDTFEITRWDTSIGGPQPTNDQLKSDVVDYIANEVPAIKARQELADSDSDMARVTEDLVDLLLIKGLIEPHDLSTDAMATMTNRKAARAKLS